jgi:UDP-3-O-[3-hydroxymyristoyl] glucosamine N-acyltransferase
MTVQQWSEFLGGRLEGRGDVMVDHPAKIEEADEHSITFIAHPKYTSFVNTCSAAAIIVGEDFESPGSTASALIRVHQPYIAFSKVLERFNKTHDHLKGISKLAMLDLSASVSDDVYIGEFAYIGPNAKIEAGAKIFPQVHIGEGVVIGENSVIYPGVIVYRDCRIGKQCIIHAGTVIGSDGFGFAPRPDGGYMKIPQLGNVIIEDEVEVGASCTIDRATLGTTVIRKGVKLDNLIHVAHNVEIGEHTVIAAQTGISGSTKIGKHCQIGGQVGLVGHIMIADGSRINAQSGVSKSLLQANKAVTGTPAFDYTAALRSQAVYKMLPELLKRVEELEQRLKESELDTHVSTLSK